ncbi:unnamed protein product [Tetraodon nigroviridis]|uniref:(spotted green pufferfish) hypothetical protein n=1 Tax=Tetraodon nigroviridis TaxID=99883 RepID=Q4RBH2_TETNG|nr:unnamed protein product [Tetraodon nigroviridis]
MPFMPPVSIVRSVSGLSGKERHISNSPLAAAPARTSVQRDDKDGSVKERLTSNLKQLGKKSQPRSFLTATKEASGAGAPTKRRSRLLEGLPASSSGESLSQSEQRKKSSARETAGDGREEQVRFTLTLTPEAVLLLQRRNSERRQRSASRNPANGGAVPGGPLDTRRRRDNICKRQHAAAQRHHLLRENLPPERAAQVRRCGVRGGAGLRRGRTRGAQVYRVAAGAGKHASHRGEGPANGLRGCSRAPGKHGMITNFEKNH